MKGKSSAPDSMAMSRQSRRTGVALSWLLVFACPRFHKMVLLRSVPYLYFSQFYRGAVSLRASSSLIGSENRGRPGDRDRDRRDRESSINLVVRIGYRLRMRAFGDVHLRGDCDGIAAAAAASHGRRFG